MGKDMIHGIENKTQTEKENIESGAGAAILLVDNEHVRELFSILEENGKDTAGLTSLINHVSGMEDFVKRAESKISDMKAQLDTMKEIQNHPFKAKLQKTISALETKVNEIKERIAELKGNIIDGCKNAVTAFKEKGADVLDKLASFFRIKDGLQAVKNDVVKTADRCDRATANIGTFANEYHKAGRAIKNLARIVVGKEPTDGTKEAGKLAQAASAPYKAQKACMLGIKKKIDTMITALDKLEQGAEVKRGENARDKPKKPTMAERLEVNKKKVKEREREAPPKERTKRQELEA